MITTNPLLMQVKPPPEYVSFLFFTGHFCLRNSESYFSACRGDALLPFFSERVSKDFVSSEPLYSIC